MSYFARVGPGSYRAGAHTGGAWRAEEQHVAPALGLLAHAVEQDRLRRGREDLLLARLSFDILGTMPVDVVEVDVAVRRPGRTIELVEARVAHGGRDVVLLRAWLLRRAPTDALAGGAREPMPAPSDLPAWDPTTVWGGGFIASVEVRRAEQEPGRARFWVRTAVPLVDDEPVGDLARAVGLLDIANGMSVRHDPRRVAFPNVDLDTHLVREPRGEWVGFDTRVEFGEVGIGLTSSVLHDAAGGLGVVNQALTLRPSK